MASYDVAGDPAHNLDLATPPPGGAFCQQQQHQHGYHEEMLAADTEQQQQAGDFVTDPIKQLLLTDMSAFFQSEVAPRSAAINEVSSCRSFKLTGCS